ncbi:hypothetical protein [Flavobacterium phycosphaerae]|uniref:hypothetical protein n=1 Tax=Flavobacterium phycosphaerae TaxID=2697515 RepID=UPI00138AD776|nr:hypothetical protein [Flavobacterium phycosphaerae]
MLIVSKYLIPKGFKAFTVFPFVILNDKGLKQDRVLLNHERIHLRQQLELLIVPFFIWYGIEFLVRYFKCRNRNTAYRAILFEKEAYDNESNFEYLKGRPFFNFVNK